MHSVSQYCILSEKNGVSSSCKRLIGWGDSLIYQSFENIYRAWLLAKLYLSVFGFVVASLFKEGFIIFLRARFMRRLLWKETGEGKVARGNLT